MKLMVAACLLNLASVGPVWSAPLPPITSATDAAGLYGSLETAPEHLAIGRGAGLNVAVVAVSWDKFEPTPGKFDPSYIGKLKEQKEHLHELGYKVQLDMGVQYPPEWIYASPNARYRDQYGDVFVTKESGKDLPNVVFNAHVRESIAAYFAGIFELLGKDWDYVRLGCSKYGELNYPQNKCNGHENCYWAFDDLAQGRVDGLPEGIVPCPVPGWTPGSHSSQNADARRFIEWYLDSLGNYQAWQIATVRRWYSGDLCMLYGSWGIRPGRLEEAISGDLAGDTAAERTGEIQQGFDWARMIGRITDPRVIVYCTWVDGTIGNRDIADDDSADPSRWSPVHWQASLAHANPMRLRVWGENTGQNNLEAMRITFGRVKRFGLIGLMWAFDRELFANPNPAGYATFTDYTQLISAERRPIYAR